MCQGQVISHRVASLGRRGYSHRMKMAYPHGYSVSQLAKLNRELDSLYDSMYDGWRSLTAEDYQLFGAQFTIMLQTMKQLYMECRKQPKTMGLEEETKRLGMNYSALYELNSDIVNFCIKMPQNEVMKSLMKRLAEVDAQLQK